MRIRTAATATLIALAVLTACGSSDEDAEPGLTAQTMVDQVSELYPLPHPRDNTGSCNQDEGKHPNSCKQLITTDPVSVYELKTEQAAAHWTKTMDGINKNHAVQAGRFMLLWKADYPSDEDAVAEMTKKAQELAAAEK